MNQMKWNRSQTADTLKENIRLHTLWLYITYLASAKIEEECITTIIRI